MNTKMRKIFTFFVASILAVSATAQVKVGNNPTTILTGSLLELEHKPAAPKALTLPRMTGSEMNSVPAPTNGMFIYNIDSNCVCQYRTSGGWRSLCNSPLAGQSQVLWPYHTDDRIIGTENNKKGIIALPGLGQQALGEYSHAEGRYDTTNADYGWAIGARNAILSNSNYSYAFGFQNKVKNVAEYSFSAGYQNTIDAAIASVSMGKDNSIAGYAGFDTRPAFIISDNGVIDNSPLSGIFGGTTNAIKSSSLYSATLGGKDNQIFTNSTFSAALTSQNGIINNSTHSSVSGKDLGLYNSSYSHVFGDNSYISASPYSTISSQNANITVGSDNSLILGGTDGKINNSLFSNIISSNYSLISQTHGSTILGSHNDTIQMTTSATSGDVTIIGTAHGSIKGTSYGSLMTNSDNGSITGVGNFNTMVASSFGKIDESDYSVMIGGHGSTFNNVSFTNTIGANITANHNNNVVVSYGGSLLSTAADNQYTALFPGGYRLFSGTGVGAQLTAGATAWTALSDRTTKENIRSNTYGLNELMRLKTYTYNYIGNPATKRNIGVMAQDVQAMMPELVQNMGNGKLGVTSTEMIPVLIKAIQEQQAQIDALKAELKNRK